MNDAGISGSAAPDMPDTDVWDKLMAVNSRGVFLGTKHAVLAMKGTGGGSVVNLSSIAGATGSDREDAHGLQRLKGRGAHADEIDCGAVRWRRHPLQFGIPGLMPPMRTSGRTANPIVRAKMLEEGYRCDVLARLMRWRMPSCSSLRISHIVHHRGPSFMSMAATSPRKWHASPAANPCGTELTVKEVVSSHTS